MAPWIHDLIRALHEGTRDDHPADFAECDSQLLASPRSCPSSRQPEPELPRGERRSGDGSQAVSVLECAGEGTRHDPVGAGALRAGRARLGRRGGGARAIYAEATSSALRSSITSALFIGGAVLVVGSGLSGGSARGRRLDAQQAGTTRVLHQDMPFGWLLVGLVLIAVGVLTIVA